MKGVLKISIAVFAVLTPLFLFAAAMTSTSYQIQSDSINFGGGIASSTNYVVGDTLGEIGTGNSSSTNYSLNAGYRQMLENSISLSLLPGSLPTISGIGGSVSTGSIAWIVTTDDPAGYSLSVNAGTSPALTSSGSSFADYYPGTNPSYYFTIASTSSAFGFSPEGTDIIAAYKNNPGGTVCNPVSGSLVDDPNACWDGFSTTTKLISIGSSNNQPNGATTTLKLHAEIGSNKFQDSGVYTATITVTAVSL